MSLQLTTDQEQAVNEFRQFLLSKDEDGWILEGFAGTGKTTLVKYLLDQIDTMYAARKLIDPDFGDGWTVRLTATTHKAAEALSDSLNIKVHTIHSALGLIVAKDKRTGSTQLEIKEGASLLRNELIFIDEASYINEEMLSFIQEQTSKCKIVYIGDPSQLTPVKCTNAPAFDLNHRKTRLNEVVRQKEGTQIMLLASWFRELVNDGNHFQFTPDGISVERCDNDRWAQAIKDEFTRPDWHHADSKVLAWTNATVNSYNKTIRELMHGEPELAVGDYAVVNNYVKLSKRISFQTDQLVKIQQRSSLQMEHGVEGYWTDLDGKFTAFCPVSVKQAKHVANQARKDERFGVANTIEDTFVDLRAAYSCTVNKAQGSTFNKVFIDLDDIGKNRNLNQQARLLYVAASRAREKVFLVGDIK